MDRILPRGLLDELHGIAVSSSCLTKDRVIVKPDLRSTGGVQLCGHSQALVSPTWCSLPHGGRSRRTPHFRAIGGPVGRAALRLATGRATCRSRTAQDPSAPEIFLNARGSCERAGPVGWGKPVTIQRNSLSRPPGRRGASPRRGRVAGPEGLGGKARRVPALVTRVARAGIRGAT